jgi:hypothetical protein
MHVRYDNFEFSYTTYTWMCDSRQRGLGELYIDNRFFVEYFLLGTRQSLCRVSAGTRQRKVTIMTPSDDDGAFTECPGSLFAECVLTSHSAKRASVGPFGSPFAECAGRHLTEGASLPSVRTTTLSKKALPVSKCIFFAD